MEKRFFSVKEAAVYTGVSKRLIYNLCWDKKLKHYHLNTKILIDKVDLDSLINAGLVETRDWDEEARELLK